ncbi:hypothetical protein G3T14_12055 [Methylobacterium sp. BTF04]|uniref:hypothetical protein n=1 Tax=Methylobacterium sp. BTF04 TaxID=2708300 RepID=UPI0013D1C6F1|nr:hypothetical protein [Methylobacterium sp. BTF04]NEU12866.1 hypothetical protein [Methylobacterium sp. BTF04]
MVDAGFTYSGEFLGVAALILWAWLAIAAIPTIANLISRYEDDLQLGRQPRARRPMLGWLGRLSRPEQAAFALTVVAIVCQSIGFAIPD